MHRIKTFFIDRHIMIILRLVFILCCVTYSPSLFSGEDGPSKRSLRRHATWPHSHLRKYSEPSPLGSAAKDEESAQFADEPSQDELNSLLLRYKSAGLRAKSRKKLLVLSRSCSCRTLLREEQTDGKNWLDEFIAMGDSELVIAVLPVSDTLSSEFNRGRCAEGIQLLLQDEQVQISLEDRKKLTAMYEALWNSVK